MFLIATSLLVVVTVPSVYAQAYNTPLTIQALNHRTSSSVSSRSLGGLTLLPRNDVSTMFSNPAALQTLQGMQVSVGGILEYKQNEQTQRWYSLDWMSTFDLFMEGKTADLRDAVIDTTRITNPTHQDTVQRNGRNPNWSRKKDQISPPQLFAALPFEMSGLKLTAGVGVVEYANLDYHYENRNAFNRNLDHISLPLSTNPVPAVAEWWGDSRTREGTIHGYGGALAATLAEGLSVGLSGMYFSGTITDRQSRERYGELQFFSKDFRYVATGSPSVVVTKGTSEVSGLELNLSGVYRARNIMLGFAINPPTKISRDFTTTGDSTYGTTTGALPQDNGTDNITLPWRGSIGLGIALRSNVFLSVEYEYKPYGTAEFTDKNGNVTNPWLGCSGFHFGVEYLPVDFVSLRFGHQSRSEVYEEEGNALYGDPITFRVYSGGVGIRALNGLQLNLGYEYMNMRYADNWNLNTNVNQDMRRTFFGSISYTLN
jgi:opacity protein-like surface antigen